jgi:hypothetical protein
MLYYWRIRAHGLACDFQRNWQCVLIFTILGLALCWLVISHSVVAYLSTVAPEMALKIRANHSQSLLRLVEDQLHTIVEDGAKTPISPRFTSSRIKTLRENAQRALIAAPLSARAYRVVGQIAEIEGTAPKAERFMYAAVRRSLNERIAVNWMMRQSANRKNHQATAYYADVLLRSTPGLIAYVTPILAQMAEDSAGKSEIKKVLATNPNWRRAFFSQLGASLTDANTPLDLFLSLKDTSAPPTTDELNSYQSFLFQHKLYDLAYNVWVQFMPPNELASAGFIFNGDFERKPSGSPFDWRTLPGANVIVAFASRPQDASNHALVLDLGPGRVDFRGVSQTILLPPGDYMFKGSFMGEIHGPRGVQWSVRCVDGKAKATLGQSKMILGSFPNWRAFEFPLIVPEDGCSAQIVELKLAVRSPSEKLVFGTLRFDDLSILRTERASN